jgi:tryptophan synthase alpha chain
MIEFGIPFSDPTADGATFQAACDRALKNGMTPTKCIEGIKKLRTSGLELPIIVTTYYNIPYVTGLETFTKKIKAAGAQAIIVPNLPIEEASDLLNEANKQNIRVIVGSAYAKIYEKNLQNPEETLPDITRLAQQIKRGCIDGYTQRR